MEIEAAYRKLDPATKQALCAVLAWLVVCNLVTLSATSFAITVTVRLHIATINYQEVSQP